MTPLPPQKKLFFYENFTVIVFTIYDENIYSPNTNESCLLKNTNQKEKKSTSDLLIMARPENLSTVSM